MHSPPEGSATDRLPISRSARLLRPDLDDRWFRAVANCTHDWESWLAPDGQLVWVNPAVERLTGYSPSECLDMTDYPLSIIAEDDRGLFARVLERASHREAGTDVEFRVFHRDGSLRWMEVSWQPMYDTDERHLGFRTSIRDITERWTLRDQFRRQADRLELIVQERTERIRELESHRRRMEKVAALGELAAGVAHEINNPLAGIRNAFELFKSGTAADHPHFDLIELVDREIERISSIVHQMYQLYRRTPQPAVEFALRDAVADVVCLLEGGARKRRIVLRLDESSNDGRVLLPEGEVKQILYNLIRNAVQASPTDSAVVVSLERVNDDVAVHVSDTGPGIPETILPRIFEPFFSTKPSEPKTGMGLGLSVSRSLTEMMGGRISVDTKPGEGSIFTVVFPLSVESQGAES